MITFEMIGSFTLKPTVAILVVCLAAMAAFGQGRTSPVVTRAGVDFDKVDAAPIPSIQDAMSCVQSNAAAVAAVRLEERYLFQYRKGYCELFGAILTSSSDGFRAAAGDFTEAIANWPTKTLAGPPAGLRVLIPIAHVEQGRTADSYPDLAKEFESALFAPSCPLTPVMSTSFCADLVGTGKVWAAWLAYRSGDLAKATQGFAVFPGSAWNLWVMGRNAQQQKQLAEAESLYKKALDTWAASEKSPSPDVVTLFGPKLDPVAIFYQLGLIDYEAGRYPAAISRFDAVIKATPKNSSAIYLRARSKDLSQQYGGALDDYILAVQTARTHSDSSWNIGQAYFYRGVLFYRQKDFVRAESELSNALAEAPKEIPATDVTAWRAMALVSGSECNTSVDVLDAASQASTDQFPKMEAAALVVNCKLKKASGLDDYLAIEKQYAGWLNSARLRDLRNQIADAYADQGVAAEDRRDSEGAIVAYRRSIEWNPVNPKSRFNLGAIYIEGKRYDLAEAEYRALVETDANDFEAQYWLGQSILAQRPAPERVADACGYLRRSVAVADPQKKAQYTKALTTAKCQN